VHTGCWWKSKRRKENWQLRLKFFRQTSMAQAVARTADGVRGPVIRDREKS
jgi:hypothetical protein